MNDSHSQPPDTGATEAQPQATTDHRSAVYAREPGHSHDAGQPCRPEACTGHPDWKTVGYTPPLEGQADPTYGGGFHPMPFSPGRVVDVGTLEERVTALEAWRIGVAPNDRDEPCETGAAKGPATTPADPADYGTDADARHHQERADRLRRDRDRWRGQALDADREVLRLRRDKAELKRELDTPRLGCATTAQLIAELAARAEVAATIGEKWPSYRTVDSR